MKNDGPYHGDDSTERAYRKAFAEAVAALTPHDLFDDSALEQLAEDRRKAKDAVALAKARARYQVHSLAWSSQQWVNASGASEIDKAISTWKDRTAQWEQAALPADRKYQFTPPPMPQDCIIDKGSDEYLYDVPGFINAVRDFTLDTAAYPNLPLAFCGSMALFSFLTGRKVQERGGLGTNLYLLSLANSGSGKDHPRKVNDRIIWQLGLSEAYIVKAVSAAGLEDALSSTPAMLLQNDEFDSILRAMGNGKETRFEELVEAFKTFHSSAGGIYPKRRKAGQAGGCIDNPHLVLLGTAVPQHFYEALSERFLSDGLFARMLVIESGKRGAGKESKTIIPPDEIIDQAQWWRDYAPGNGNFSGIACTPRILNYTPEADSVFQKARQEIDRQYDATANNGEKSILARVIEHARKLALLYSVSQDRYAEHIDLEAANWGIAFATRQAKFTLQRVAGSVAANPFDALCLKFVAKLKEAGGKLEHSVMLKRMKVPAKQFRDIVVTLHERREISVASTETKGRPLTEYVLSKA